MSTIDNKIIEMKFENSHFKRGVDTTLSAISTLKNALRFDGATKGLQGIDAAAKNVKIDQVGAGAERVSAKFSAMSAIALGALASIGAKAVATGTQMAQAFTIRPMQEGLAEYELKMGSIQTIMAGSGESLDVVNEKLQALNEYSDRTIYSFKDMTSNIGKFTNAGVDLDTAVGSIQGISNVAAISGADANEASRAMYNFSQAISAGHVKLMDWKSIELANMATKEFKQELIDSGVAAGTLTKEVDGTYKTLEGTPVTALKGFNESLTDQWLTAEALNETLGRYSDETTDIGKRAFAAAQDVKTFSQLMGTLQEAAGSGWAASWEIIIGDFNEAKNLWTGVNNTLSGMIGASADARNKLLGDWKEAGGRDAAINAIGNAFKALMAIMGAVKTAFQSIFPPMTGQQLANITKAIENFTAKLIPSQETVYKIQNTLRGFFAVLDIGLYVLKLAAGVLTNVFGAMMSGESTVLNLSSSFGNWLVTLRDSIKQGDGLVKFFNKISTFLVLTTIRLKQFGAAIIDGFKSLNLSFGGAEKGLDKVTESLSPLQTIGRVIGRIFKALIGSLGGVWKTASKVGQVLREMFGALGTTIMDSMSKVNFNQVLDLVNTGLFAVLAFSIKKFLGGIGDNADDLTGKLNIFDKIRGTLDNVKGVLTGVTDTLGQMQASLKVGTLLMIAAALALMAASIVALSMIDSDKLTKALAALGILTAQLVAAMTVLNGLSLTNGLLKMAALGLAMILMAIAINILASAVRKLAELEWEELAKGLAGVVVMMGALVLAAKGMSGHAGGMISAGVGLILLATAIRILVGAVEAFAALSWEELAKGLSGVAALLLALGLFTKFSNVEKMGVLAGAGLILLGVGIRILATAVEQFAGLSWEEIAKGLVSVGALLGMIAIFAATSGNGLMLIGTAAGLTIIAAALNILATAMISFGSMSWEEIARGLVAMGGALLIISGAMILMAGAIPGALALIVVAHAMTTLGPVLMTFATLGWEAIAAGLTMLAGSLIIIAGAMLLMAGALPGAAALVIVAGSLAVLLPVLMALSTLSWGELLIALAALAGVFLVLGVAGLVLGPVVPVLIALGAAIVLLGVGVLLAGAGVFLFATALTALAAAGAVGAAALVGIVATLLGLLPTIVRAVGETIIEIAKVIGVAAPYVIQAIVILISSLLQAIARLTPQILRTFEIILRGFLNLIIRNTPLILRTFEVILRGVLMVVNRNAPLVVQTFMRMLDLLLAAAVRAVPRITAAGMQMIIGFLTAIRNKVPQIVTIAADIIVRFINGVAKALPRIIQAGVNLIISFIEGLAKAVRNNSERMNKAGRDLASAVVSGMTSGLTAGASAIADQARSVARGALDAAKRFLGINSPSREFMKLGRWSSEGMALGIDKYSGTVAESARGVGMEAIFSMRKSIAGLAKALDGEMDSNPRITPVLDLSEVRAGVKKMDPLLNTPSIEIDTSRGRARAILAQRSNTSENDRFSVEDVQQTQPVQLTYIQTINSPKAVSAIDVYRDTKNQLSVVKGGIEDAHNVRGA